MVVCEELAQVMRLVVMDIVRIASDEQFALWVSDGLKDKDAIRDWKRPAGFIAARKRAGRRPTFGAPPEWYPQTERSGEAVMGTQGKMSLLDVYLEDHMGCEVCWGPRE